MRALPALMVLGVLLGACAAPTTAPAPTSAPATAPPTTAPTTAPAVQKPTETLRFGTFLAPNLTLDPYQAIPAGNLQYLSLMFDTLVNLDLIGKLTPGLATNWTVGDKVIDMDLMQGVVFHDGTPFNADAVKANIEHTQMNGAPPIAARLASIDKVEVIDPYKVRLHLKENDPVLLYALTRQSGMMVSPKGLDTAQDNPLGTGPYVFNKGASTLDSVLTFDAFDQFYDPSQQHFASVVLIAYPEQVVRANALRQGEIDGAAISGADAAALEKEGFFVAENVSVVFALVLMDREGKIVKELADPRVREALQYAIDRTALIDVIEGGIGAPTTQLYNEGDPWHVPDLPAYSYDPDKARALLEEAGVSDLTFRMPVAPIFADRTQALAGLLQKVGIKVELVPVELPHTVTYVTGDYGIVYAPVEVLHPKDFAEQYFLPQGLWNIFGNVDPEIQALYDQARAASGPEADALWTSLIKMAIEKNYIIFAADISEPVVAAPYLKGVNLQIYAPITPTWRTMYFEK
jgi:peptide/nickel transport system substrate-binding protein